MDEFSADVFTFRRSDDGIVNDVILKDGFRDDELLDNLTDVELQDFAPYVFGYHHLHFN